MAFYCQDVACFHMVNFLVANTVDYHVNLNMYIGYAMPTYYDTH